MLESAMVTGHVVKGRRNPLHFTLSERLRKAREDAGFPARKLCAMAGVSNGTITNVENGTIPGIDLAERVARALNVSPCFLAFGVEGAPLPALAPDEALRAAGCGARVLRLREVQGLTRADLARAAGLTGQAILNTEDGRSIPTVATAEALAVALGCSPCWICYGEGPDPLVDPQGAAAELSAVKYRPPRSPRKPPATRRRRVRSPA